MLSYGRQGHCRHQKAFRSSRNSWTSFQADSRLLLRCSLAKSAMISILMRSQRASLGLMPTSALAPSNRTHSHQQVHSEQVLRILYLYNLRPNFTICRMGHSSQRLPGRVSSYLSSRRGSCGGCSAWWFGRSGWSILALGPGSVGTLFGIGLFGCGSLLNAVFFVFVDGWLRIPLVRTCWRGWEPFQIWLGILWSLPGLILFVDTRSNPSEY